MPTGVPANQLNEDEKRAVLQAVLWSIIHGYGSLPNDANRDDLIQAYYKLAAQAERGNSKRTYKKKGTVKKVNE